MHNPVDAPDVLVFPPLLFGATLALGLLLHWSYPVNVLPLLLSRVLGTVILIVSVLLALSAKAVMKRAGTNIRPDQPTIAIVSNGPFRYTRNPLYLAATGIYVSITLLVDALWPLVLLGPMLVLLVKGVVVREEQYLAAKFGDEYRNYKTRVRRWL
jgi:protein-S-isoprenylcysteine O-methyltransferase Ste14